MAYSSTEAARWLTPNDTSGCSVTAAIRRLRIARAFELERDEAVLRKEGDRLIIEPVRKDRLLPVLASLEGLEEPFPDVDKDLAPLDEVER